MQGKILYLLDFDCWVWISDPRLREDKLREEKQDEEKEYRISNLNVQCQNGDCRVATLLAMTPGPRNKSKWANSGGKLLRIRDWGIGKI